jgi:hypothetical protein
MRGDARGVQTAQAIRAFVNIINALGNPDLQIVEFASMNGADKVICAGACRLLAIFAKKPAGSTVDAWLKGSNHATVAAANGDIVTFFVGTGGGGKEYFQQYGDGLPLGTGLTIQAHTTVNGNTKSQNVDCPSGFVVIRGA